VKVSLTVAGIALGVAVSTAITIASDTAERSFENATAFLKPTAGTVVGSTVGRVPEGVLPRLRSLPGVERIVPFSSRVVAARADGRSLGTVRVVGTDLFGVELPGQGQGQDKEESKEPDQQNREDSLSLFRDPPSDLVSKSHADA
jgi:hypothetical protein